MLLNGIKQKIDFKSRIYSQNTGMKSLQYFKGSNNEPVGQKTDTKESNTSKILVWAIGVATVATAAVMIFKKGRNSPVKAVEETVDKHQASIIKGLKDKFGIDVKPKSLQSIVGIEEFGGLVKKYSPSDFSLGNSRSEDPKEFFKNVIDGKFRVSLHSHSVFSDGRLTPQKFIDMAAQYADKVAKKLPKEDMKPPFVVALTDHDTFEGCQEIVKIIAQNPEKYKNLKFVSGAELSVKDSDKHFDLTALGVNPFDENLNKFMDTLKLNRENSARDFVSKANKIAGTDLKLEELEKIDYKGKKTLQNKRGVVYVNNVMHVVMQNVDNKHHRAIKSMFDAQNYSDKDIPILDSVIKAVKDSGANIAWTHPARSFSNRTPDWHKNYLQKLQSAGVTGVEANHQYTAKHYQEISNLEQINASLRDYAQNNNMFLCGGTDSHKYDIFGHHHKISDELLKSFLE